MTQGAVPFVIARVRPNATVGMFQDAPLVEAVTLADEDEQFTVRGTVLTPRGQLRGHVRVRLLAG